MTPDRLRRLIEGSGMSQQAFARDVVSRDPRTVRRWLAGEVIPPVAVDFLERIESVRVGRGRVRVVVRME